MSGICGRRDVDPQVEKFSERAGHWPETRRYKKIAKKCHVVSRISKHSANILDNVSRPLIDQASGRKIVIQDKPTTL